MKKYRFILLPLVSGLVIFLTTVLFTLPKLKATVVSRGELEEKKERLSRLTGKATLLESLDEYELEKKVAIAEKALPSKKALAEILVGLSSLSSENGVSFIGFSIAPGGLLPEEFEELVFQATFEGARDKLESFLGKLNQVLPIMKVTSFDIQEEKIMVKIESYSSPLPESLGKIDAPLPQITKEEEKIYQTIAQFESFEKKLPTLPTGKENLFSEF